MIIPKEMLREYIKAEDVNRADKRIVQRGDFTGTGEQDQRDYPAGYRGLVEPFVGGDWQKTINNIYKATDRSLPNAPPALTEKPQTDKLLLAITTKLGDIKTISHR